MKIVVIGATGAVGKAVVEQLGQRHELVTVGSSSGQYQVKFEDEASVRALFAQLGKVDAVVVTAGELHFGPLHEMTPEQFRKGLNSKLMGQVNVALVAQDTYLFNDTLRQNILIAQPHASEDDIRQAVHHASLDELVAALPDGLDSRVGERGTNLSGGLWWVVSPSGQRVTETPPSSADASGGGNGGY